MKNFKGTLFVLGFVLLAGCESEPSERLQDSIVESSASSNFDPTNSVIPFPNDLLFKDSVDATLNIPVADANDLSDPSVALNALDGFSTVAPMSTGFTDSILSSSISGESVRLYKVSLSSTPLPGGAVVAVNKKLTFGVDYFATVSSVDTTGKTLAILPLIPLDEASHYYVVITHDLKSSDGKAMGVSSAYALAKGNNALVDGDGVSQSSALTDAQALALEPLRQLVNTSETFLLANDSSLTLNEIIMGWSFTTQSIGDVLTKVRADIREGAVPVTALTDSGADSPVGGEADIWVGSLDVPYYLTAAANSSDPTPLGTFWQGAGGSHLTRFNTTPVATSTQTIPLMVSVPKTDMPVAGFPVVIYQHGITANRTSMLLVADELAKQGIAIAAIDMPLHGVTGNESNGTQVLKTTFERTFDLNLVTQPDLPTETVTALVPDGKPDTSGLHFLNLKSLLTFRDNGRQAVSDLFTLAYAIDNLTAGGSTFDNSKIYYVGHSAGAIVGSPFVALESTLKDAVIAHAGGYVMKVLDGSSQFSPLLVGGLAASGVLKGTAEYESFLGAAQTVSDSVDPLNYVSTLANRSEGILFFEIVGGNSASSDLAVPITVPDANDLSTGTGPTIPSPLAGTEPLLSLLGLTQTNASITTGDNLKLSVKYIAGVHRSLFDPSTDPDVTLEMQTQMATFLKNDGNTFTVNNDTLLQAP